MSDPITRHGQPFAPTYSNPETDEEKRVYIAEARAYANSGYMKDDSTAPLPEMFVGHYEAMLGLSSPWDALAERKPTDLEKFHAAVDDLRADLLALFDPFVAWLDRIIARDKAS